MSASVATIPKRATVAREAIATAPDGRRARFAVYADAISLGYQSNYRRTPARWYVLEAPGLRRAWRHTGQRVEQADREYAGALREALRAGWTVQEVRP